jgi:hypothetical protein
MTWKDVTVWQMQQIANVLAKTENETGLDISVKVLGILTNRTESQIDSLSLQELKSGLKDIKFINDTQPEAKPIKYINVNGRRYKCIYDIKKLPYARYIETKHFGNDVLLNLHKIGASMVMPMKKTWLGWKEDKYDASKHEEYANDLLEAKYESVYGSVVFFCQVYIHLINNLGDYLKSRMVRTGMTQSQAEITMDNLCNVLAGFTKLPSSQNTKE